MASDKYKFDKTLVNVGNGPYAKCKIGTIHCTVDTNPDNPWQVTGSVDAKIEITEIGGQRGSRVYFTYGGLWSEKYGGWDYVGAGTMGVNMSWEAYNKGVSVGGWGTIDSNTGWVSKTLSIKDIRVVLGDNFNSHQWYKVKVKTWYAYTGFYYVFGWSPVSNSELNFTADGYIYTPRVCGGPSSKWGGSLKASSSYAYKTITMTGNYWGLIKGNEWHTVYLKVNGKTIAQESNQTSGTLKGKYYVPSPGTYTVTFECDGKKFGSQSFTFREPPPEAPTMGWVSNNTPVSINTTRRKHLAASWGISDDGWPSAPKANPVITYHWECYGSNHGLIKQGDTTATSTSFDWDIPQQQTGTQIYWKVRAKSNTNSLGWGNTVTSENREVFWAYTEPSKISNISISPNRFQLFYGGTLIKPSVSSKINAWGDRPGTRNVEYEMRTDTGTLKWYGRTTTDSTTGFTQTLSITVPDNHLHKTYYAIAHKRLDNTEYTFSGDPRYPTIGQNNVSAPITFYEVQGKILGSFNLSPTVIISGLPSEINYSFNYDRQSSQKVDLYLEVYRISTGQVTHTTKLEYGAVKSNSGVVKDTLVVKYQADRYELRFKAKVTELLGNTNTYTLATLTPEVYNPPVGHISLDHVSLPLPTDNANAILAKQATDITWNYDYSFQGVNITKVLLTIESKPYGKELAELPFNASSSPYYNKYLRKTKGDFELGSTVKASIMIYYQVIGYPITYTEPTNSFTINITPTRYLYYLTQTSTGERQLVKIHPLVNGKDKISKKIHVD